MALLKYFKPINRSTSPLSEIVPLSSIEAANKEVESIVSQVEKSSIENDPEGNTVLLKGNVANERLSLLVSRSNSHATQETKRTELKPL